ncbi:hypothetical protein CONLIGDRAFT_648007 [Coniochaeta ligniaria NRRL 30616]|uniref:Uncharacterized protein n=1 Tax=Coniochaeta ligniaria NRRL 30616 TaxID=1408157 RepID=A0A1J7J531_9PEZI|nr:hypothetical protein CONLIGDRAFT_648007 [Coniochaeta ligniaria NRRL 30616]
MPSPERNASGHRGRERQSEDPDSGISYSDGSSPTIYAQSRQALPARAVSKDEIRTKIKEVEALIEGKVYDLQIKRVSANVSLYTLFSDCHAQMGELNDLDNKYRRLVDGQRDRGEPSYDPNDRDNRAKETILERQEMLFARIRRHMVRLVDDHSQELKAFERLGDLRRLRDRLHQLASEVEKSSGEDESSSKVKSRSGEDERN